MKKVTKRDLLILANQTKTIVDALFEILVNTVNEGSFGFHWQIWKTANSLHIHSKFYEAIDALFRNDYEEIDPWGMLGLTFAEERILANTINQYLPALAKGVATLNIPQKWKPSSNATSAKKTKGGTKPTAPENEKAPVERSLGELASDISQLYEYLFKNIGKLLNDSQRKAWGKLPDFQERFIGFPEKIKLHHKFIVQHFTGSETNPLVGFGIAEGKLIAPYAKEIISGDVNFTVPSTWILEIPKEYQKSIGAGKLLFKNGTFTKAGEKGPRFGFRKKGSLVIDTGENRFDEAVAKALCYEEGQKTLLWLFLKHKIRSIKLPNVKYIGSHGRGCSDGIIDAIIYTDDGETFHQRGLS